MQVQRVDIGRRLSPRTGQSTVLSDCQRLAAFELSSDRWRTLPATAKTRPDRHMTGYYVTVYAPIVSLFSDSCRDLQKT